VLIDSGSDGGLALNPTGLHPRFVHGPARRHDCFLARRRQTPARRPLEQNITVGTQLVQQPVVDLTEQLSSLGGELLRHFRITFDQQRHFVTLLRSSDGRWKCPDGAATGLSFRRFPKLLAPAGRRARHTQQRCIGPGR